MNLLTRRIPTILGLLLLIAGVVGGWWYITNNKPEIPAGLIPRKVRVTNVADNKFTVSWTTTTATSGDVEYGAVGEKLTKNANDDRDQGEGGTYLTHHVTVDELQPETQYAFRILSGGKNYRFDNNGSSYAVTTGPTIAVTPPAKSLYGEVSAASAPGSAAGAIVYLGLPGAAPVSTIVTTSSNYTFAISTVRTSDLQQYLEYDQLATVANITVESGKEESLVTVTTANSAPVPKIILGQNADYRSETPSVAQVEPEGSAAPTTTSGAVTPGIFNVEPLDGSEERASGSNEVVLLNPEEEGEELATTKPEFRGTGPEAKVLSITVQSIVPYSDTVTVDTDGTWSWTPPADLAPGEHTVTIAYIDEAGTEQSLVRKFFVSTALAAEGDPAITATPSGSTLASPLASVKPSVSPTPTASGSAGRETMPSTESGVPITGLLSPTLLTGAVGIVIMILGVLLLAL